MRKTFLSILILIIPFISLKAQIQSEPTDSLRKDAVKLFIDCLRCDMNFIRREIPYVNYVRDVKEAQLYIRETRQSSGSGGAEYSFFFEGQEKFEGLTDTLVYSSRPDDTSEHLRQGRTNMIKMGLMRYVARTPIYQEVNIIHEGIREVEEVSDKWNNWVFELKTRPRFNIEESFKSYSYNNSFDINKITEKWKFELGLSQQWSKTKYMFGDIENIAVRTSVKIDNLIVKSLSEHWSVGIKTELLTSTFKNAKFQADLFPSVEYNTFPYSESTHHQLRFLYGIGMSFNEYNDSTIYGEIKENSPKHQLQVAYQVQEKWGSVNVSLEGSNYLNDFSKNRIELEGSINIRVIKGLSFSITGGVAKVQDQLSLAAGDLSEADILLQLSEQASGYEIQGGLSISYTFGSIFNNVVNPRFGNGRGFGGYGGGGGGGYGF